MKASYYLKTFNSKHYTVDSK